MNIKFSIIIVLLSILTLQNTGLTEQGKTISISNKHTKLTIDATTGEIISLLPGTKSLRGPWFEIFEENRSGVPSWKTFIFGKESIFNSGPAKYVLTKNADMSKITLTWNRANGLLVTGEIILKNYDKGPLFRLTVKNLTGEYLVDKIRVPFIKGVELGNKDDDWFTYPHTLGAAFRVDGFKPGERMEDPYPALMFMQWLDCYDDNEGVYIGANDDYGYNKSLIIGKDTDGKSVMGVNFGGCWIAEKNDSWTTPWVQIASHKGDWHAGADIYRSFAEKAFGPPNAPEIIREMPTAQVWLSYHASNKETGNIFEIQQQAPIHSSYIMKSLNTSYPEGWDGFQGSALEYHDAFDKIRELGGSPALFTFDRAPLMGRPNHADYASKWLRMRRDGSFDEGFKDMIAIPLDKDFIRARVDEAVRWVREFNIDEIHYDTEATCGDTGEVGVGMFAGPAYNNNAGVRPNEVPHYFKELYNKTLTACRKYNPNFTLRGEDCADFFFPSILTSTAHYFTTSQIVKTRNFPTDAKMIPMLLRYTLPKYTSYLMPSVSSDDFWTYGLGMGYGFHGGGPSWCINSGVRENEEPSGDLANRYNFYDTQWRQYYDFRVGFEETVVDADSSENKAQAFIDGKWISCEFPNPLIAVTHIGGGREVTLGQWYHRSETADFGNIFIDKNRLEPRPIKIRIPTNIKNPSVRLYGIINELPCNPVIEENMIELDIKDPTCFAVEVYTGPSITLTTESIVQPGSSTKIHLSVNQIDPKEGSLKIKLPKGWPEKDAIKIPAVKKFEKDINIILPKGIFGRNYPIKATMEIGSIKRTAAAHLKVIEPLSVTYSFDTLNDGNRMNLNSITPGKMARFTLTCINNTEKDSILSISIKSNYVNSLIKEKILKIDPYDLGNNNSNFMKWFKGNKQPDNVLIKHFDFDCTGVPDAPFYITISMNNKIVFKDSVYPRTYLMDLNGEWKVRYINASKANSGGIFGRDFMDFEATTPDIWDGDWEKINTPFTLPESKWDSYAWAIYRRMVFIPAEWQGNDIQLRLQSMGGLRWGPEGALNIVYINGWPAGRIGVRGDKSLSSFIIFGGWNLFSIISSSPQRLVDPYLFVREAKEPQTLQLTESAKIPDGAFINLSSRPTGQGILPAFITGVPEVDHRRTDTKTTWVENEFIYFSVADQFVFEPKQPVQITIEYLDNGFDPVGLHYDSYDIEAISNGAFKSAPEFKRTNSDIWKTHSWILNDARLSNRQHAGTDFRIYGSSTDLHVRRVEIKLINK